MEEFSIETLRYLIKYPKDFSKSGKYPVLFLFHGAGSRHSDTSKLPTNVFFRITNKFEEFPFVVVAPLCSENTWFDMWEKLKRMVKEVIAQPYVDKERVYIMGTSMGVYATWQMGMSLPECFAAIVPICGGGMYWNAARLAGVPVWAFHGGQDKLVLPEESQKMVDAVNTRGGNATLTIYPNNKHDAWTDTYSNPEVYEWLLSHRNSNFVGDDHYDDAEKYG